MGGTSKSIRKGVKKNFRIFKTLNTPFSVSFLFRFASFLVVTVLPTLSLSLSLSKKKKCERWARLRCRLLLLSRGVYFVRRGGVFVEEEERVVFRELDWRHQ